MKQQDNKKKIDLNEVKGECIELLLEKLATVLSISISYRDTDIPRDGEEIDDIIFDKIMQGKEMFTTLLLSSDSQAILEIIEETYLFDDAEIEEIETILQDDDDIEEIDTLTKKIIPIFEILFILDDMIEGMLTYSVDSFRYDQPIPPLNKVSKEDQSKVIKRYIKQDIFDDFEGLQKELIKIYK